MKLFIDSDLLYSISSYIIIFTSSFLKSLIEMNVPDVSWFSVYHFITSSNKDKRKIISSFLNILKKKGEGEAMLTEVKSSIPNGSSNHVDAATNLQMESSSSNAAASGSTSASSSGTGTGTGTGIPMQSALNITADVSFMDIPFEVPPTQDKRVPPNSSLWRDLRARYVGQGEDDYKPDNPVQAKPILKEGDTGYQFNYNPDIQPSRQAREACKLLRNLHNEVKQAHWGESNKKMDSPASNPRATHQYLACRDDYQKRFVKYKTR